MGVSVDPGGEVGCGDDVSTGLSVGVAVGVSVGVVVSSGAAVGPPVAQIQSDSASQAPVLQIPAVSSRDIIQVKPLVQSGPPDVLQESLHPATSGVGVAVGAGVGVGVAVGQIQSGES